MIVGAAVSQITGNSSRGSATSFADDLVFADYTPKLTTSTVIIQGVANFDSANSQYCRYRWVINGSNFLSTPGYTTPLYTHQFYSNTSLNNYGYMPSTIITSVNNTNGSAITVKCQGRSRKWNFVQKWVGRRKSIRFAFIRIIFRNSTIGIRYEYINYR